MKLISYIRYIKNEVSMKNETFLIAKIAGK
jgi:hypothetical protein